MLQLPDLSLVAVNFPLQTFNLLFVVVNFLLVMLLQSSQLLLLLTPFVIRCTGENKGYAERKREEQEKNGSIVMLCTINSNTIVCCKRKMYVLEVHLFLCGLFLPHCSTCLSDGPSSTTTFSGTFTQLTQLSECGWGPTKEKCLVTQSEK